MGLSLILDILVAGLLVVTIGYAVVLNRRLRTLRQDRGQLESLAAVFAKSTARAEDGISRLRRSAGDLRGETEKAQALREDLAFLIERATSAADRLEDAVRAARREVPPAPPAASAASETRHDDGDELAGKSEAERELLRALQSSR